jgi:hypothetical protein
MREIRQSGSEGGAPQTNAASLPLLGSTERSIAFGVTIPGESYGTGWALLGRP